MVTPYDAIIVVIHVYTFSKFVWVEPVKREQNKDVTSSMNKFFLGCEKCPNISKY